MATTCAARIHPIKQAELADFEQRAATRQACVIEATSRPLEMGDGMSWGGVVTDLSAGSLKLGLCFPFSPATYLAVDLQSPAEAVSRTLVCPRVHLHDHPAAP